MSRGPAAAIPLRALTAEELRKFAARVGPPNENGCWLWNGRIGKSYPKFQLDGKTVSATRLMLRIVCGPAAPGLCACHRCDTPSCVNPAHLFLGTQYENVQDRSRKGRTTRAPRLEGRRRGSKHHRSKLKEADVLEIRRRSAAGEKSVRLAEEFGCTDANIALIVLRKNWRHL